MLYRHYIKLPAPLPPASGLFLTGQSGYYRNNVMMSCVNGVVGALSSTVTTSGSSSLALCYVDFYSIDPSTGALTSIASKNINSFNGVAVNQTLYGWVAINPQYAGVAAAGSFARLGSIRGGSAFGYVSNFTNPVAINQTGTGSPIGIGTSADWHPDGTLLAHEDGTYGTNNEIASNGYWIGLTPYSPSSGFGTSSTPTTSIQIPPYGGSFPTILDMKWLGNDLLVFLSGYTGVASDRLYILSFTRSGNTISQTGSLYSLPQLPIVNGTVHAIAGPARATVFGNRVLVNTATSIDPFLYDLTYNGGGNFTLNGSIQATSTLDDTCAPSYFNQTQTFLVTSGANYQNFKDLNPGFGQIAVVAGLPIATASTAAFSVVVDQASNSLIAAGLISNNTNSTIRSIVSYQIPTS
jgi:hypothetical protein